MSSDNDASKTEKPTPKKLKDARKEGNVAHSKDLSMFMAIATIILAIVSLDKYFIASLSDNYNIIFQTIKSKQFVSAELAGAAMQILANMTKMLLPVIVLAALVALLTTVCQYGGFLITDKLFKMELKKFNPIDNAKEILSKKNWIKFFFNVLKLGIMATISFMIFESNLDSILLLVNIPLPQMIMFVSRLLLKIMLVLLGCYLVFALADLILEKNSTYKKLMMSLEEIKKEHKDSEGDPEIKNKRKELHKEMLGDDDEAFNQFKDSMLVLANPTHIAIVIIYVPQKWRLPIMVFKGKGYDAQQIFQFARRKKIPIIRDKWLARRMYEIAEINKFIPPSLIKHIAELIAKNLALRPQIAENIELMKRSSQTATNVPVKPNTVVKPRNKPFNTKPL